MKRWSGILLAAMAIVACSADGAEKQLNVRVVNFKKCVEQSKLGKQEQGNFEGLKKQMETVLEEKEKTLTSLADKLSDPDYVDSISPEAETDMKRKFRALNQEYTQQQSQYMQTLNQMNFKVVQKMSEVISKVTGDLAKESHLDLVLNEEGCFFYAPELDFSDKVIEVMDKQFQKEPADKS